MYKFDVALEAKSTMKERVIWMLYLGTVFFLLYGSANQLTSLTAPHPSFVIDWENSIPFVDAFIVPYMSSDLMFVIAFLLPYTRLELRILALRVFFIVLLSVVIFVLFPLQFSFEKPTIENFKFLFKALEADLPFNQLPSLHVGFVVILWYSMAPKINSLLVKMMLFSWFILIVASTLLVYQHHFIDLPTGAMVGFLAIYLIHKKSESKLLRAFMTPRSLKMAFYYLVGAIIFMVLAFKFSTVWFLFIWLFASLLTVSVAYAFGWEWLLVSKDSKANLFQKLFLLPYFLGNYLSLQYYSKKLKPFSKVEEGLYIGRYLKENEYQALKEQNINHSLNLALEQQFQKPVLKEKRLALMDQTIQNPKALHEAVLYIEEHDGVYVHCALGLSRSILVISAWLIYHGKSLDEVYEILEKVRPKYVKSEYMRINLEIYSRMVSRLKFFR
jgi:membrane-associated phospholipid phosphatase